MAEQLYKDPIMKKYFDLIESVIGTSFFKGLYYGDPIKIPISNLPALIISKDETRADVLTSAEDVHQIALTLTVVTDIRDDINDDKSLAPGTSSLYDILEGRESDTLKLKTKSLLHILRNNVDVDTALGLRTDLGSITRVDYGMTVGKRQKDQWSIEAQLEFNAHFSQIR